MYETTQWKDKLERLDAEINQNFETQRQATDTKINDASICPIDAVEKIARGEKTAEIDQLLDALLGKAQD